MNQNLYQMNPLHCMLHDEFTSTDTLISTRHNGGDSWRTLISLRRLDSVLGSSWRTLSIIRNMRSNNQNIKHLASLSYKIPLTSVQVQKLSEK